MSAASTAPAAKARIVELLQAWPALAAVQVSYSGPVREADVAPEMVFLGAVEGTSEWRSLGATTRTETYRLDIFCTTFQPTADSTEQEAEERCYALWSEVCKALSADHSLGNLLGGGNQQPKDFTQRTTPTLEPTGFSARLDGKIDVVAYLQLP